MGCTHSCIASPRVEVESSGAASGVDSASPTRRRSRLSQLLRGSSIARSLMRRVSRPHGYADHLFEPLEPTDNGQNLVTGESQLKVSVSVAFVTRRLNYNSHLHASLQHAVQRLKSRSRRSLAHADDVNAGAAMGAASMTGAANQPMHRGALDAPPPSGILARRPSLYFSAMAGAQN